MANLVAFAVRCNLIGFIRIVLERPEFSLEKKPYLITQFMKLAIENRRVDILLILIQFAESKRLAVYEECEHPLIFVYKRSYGPLT